MSEYAKACITQIGHSADLEVAQHLGSGWLEVELHGKLEVVVDRVQASRHCQQPVVMALLQEDPQGFEHWQAAFSFALQALINTVAVQVVSLAKAALRRQ